MYSDLRSPSDRPMTRDMSGRDEVSPCRGCQNAREDKNEFPACMSCQKLSQFQGRDRPVNLDIDRSVPKYLKYHGSIYTPARRKKRRSTLAGIICSICKETEASCHGYKHLHTAPICNRCFNRLAARFKRTGQIRFPSGGV
jgi:hypothetical protein